MTIVDVGQDEGEGAELLARDPVCGRDVALTRAAGSTDYSGSTHYFCSLTCQQDFERQPDRYVETPLPLTP